MKKMSMLLGICGLLVFSSSVSAENYAGFYYAIVSPGDMDFDSPTFSFSVDPENGNLLGFKLGHQEGVLNVEVEYSFISGTDIESELVISYPPNVYLDADISYKTLMLNILARKPSGEVHPYIGVGVGQAWFKIRNPTFVLPYGYIWVDTGTQYYSYGNDEDNCFVFQFLLGLQLDFGATENFSLDIGYRFFQVGPEFSDLEVDTEYESHNISLGIVFWF